MQTQTRFIGWYLSPGAARYNKSYMPPTIQLREYTRKHLPGLPREPIIALPNSLREVSVLEGVRAALAVAVLVAMAQLGGWPGLMWSAIAAFWTCLADTASTIRNRVAMLLTFSFVGALTCTVAAFSPAYGLALILPLSFLWALGGAFASAYGSGWGTVGTLITVVFVASSERPPIDNNPVEMGLLFLLGGLWASVFSLILWRIQPFLPMRLAVSAAYEANERFAQDLDRLVRKSRYSAEDWEAHARRHRQEVRAAIESARNILAPVPRFFGPASREGDRLLLLLETADQLLGQLAALSDILERLVETDRRHKLPSELRLILRHLTAAITALTPTFRQHGRQRERRLEHTERLLEGLERATGAGAQTAEANQHDAWNVLAAMVTRLRIAHTLAKEREPSSPLHATVPSPALRTVSPLALLQENLSPASPIFRHAFRRAVTVTIAVALVMLLHLPFGYWLTMSTVLVLQPFVAATWQRTLERAGGSALGGAIGAVAGLALDSPIERLFLIVPLTVVTMAVRAGSYGLYVSLLTPLFVLVADLGHPGPHALEFAGWRIANSVAGSAIGLIGGLTLWPNRAVGRLPDRIAVAIAASGEYAACVMDCPGAEKTSATVDAARRATGIASGAAESALQQVLLEPGRTQEIDTEAAVAIVAALRRVAGTATTLYLRGTTSDAVSASGEPFSSWVRSAANGLAEAMRERRSPGEWVPWAGATNPDTEDLPARIARQFELIHGALRRLYVPH